VETVRTPGESFLENITSVVTSVDVLTNQENFTGKNGTREEGEIARTRWTSGLEKNRIKRDGARTSSSSSGLPSVDPCSANRRTRTSTTRCVAHWP